MAQDAQVRRIACSFRDPAGHVFLGENGEILRSIAPEYAENYDLLCSSGLKECLLKNQKIIPFEECEASIFPGAYKALRIEKIPFITYPYEWSFEQLKDAALLTLELQRLALQHNMMLKDASAYNVQFHHGRAIFIDILSFEKADDRPLPAYGQFCSHFLAPLALMGKTDIDLNIILSQYIDGMPLALAAKLLPWSSHLNLGLLIHIHAHAKMQNRHSNSMESAKKAKTVTVSIKNKLLLVESLINTVKGIKRFEAKTEWADYYSNTNYDDDAFKAKKQLVLDFAARFAPQKVLDIGANTGIFSRLASQNGNLVVAADIDPIAVDKHYVYLKRESIKDILPLRINLSNPSPAIGWNNQERDSFFDRCEFDLVMALALIHHLAITNNVPLEMVAATLARLGKHLIIEFVPKEDSQVQKLLASRKDIFPKYDTENFLQAFGSCFKLLQRKPIPGSSRELFLFERTLQTSKE